LFWKLAYNNPMESSQQKILNYCLKNCIFDGWNTELLNNASISAGLEQNYHKILFPGGVADVLEYFTLIVNQQMEAGVNLAGLGTTKKVQACVEYRLELLKPHKAALKSILKEYAKRPALALKCAYSAVDSIWRISGDTATDFNFYTKRTLLAGVYTSTIWKFLDDDSPNHTQTKEFLAARLAQVGSFGKKVSEFKKKFTVN
jgi:ubiquinone biosynthesis protein COQ9